MQLLVIDGQGGGVGKSLIAAVKRLAPEQAVIAAGTNAQATAAMLRRARTWAPPAKAPSVTNAAVPT